MVVDCPHGEHEPFGDLAVLQAPAHQCQHLQLVGREPVLVLAGRRPGAALQRRHASVAESSGHDRSSWAGLQRQQFLQRQAQPRLVVGVGQASASRGTLASAHNARPASHEPASCRPCGEAGHGGSPRAQAGTAPPHAELVGQDR